MNDDYYKQLQELYHSVKLEMTNLGYFNELAHHGIKGQKWGVRRFQNQDGTLTDAGKKRYSNGSSSSNGSTLLSPSQKHNFEYNRRRKLSAKESDAELEDLTKWYNSDFEDPIYQDEVAMKKSLDLQREIIKFSGDLYNSKGVSPGFKECIRDASKKDREITKKYDNMPGHKAVKEAWDEMNERYREIYNKHFGGFDKDPNGPAGMKIRRSKFERIFDKKFLPDLRADAKYNELDKKYSEAHKSEDYNRERSNKWREESNNHHSSTDKLLGVVLTDLGYKDTPKARELIYYLVITD